MRPLGILLPELGLYSETFVRWDVEELLPGGTALVVDPPPGGASMRGPPVWRSGAPMLAFTPLPGDPPPPASRREEVRAFFRRHGVEVALVEYLDFADRWLDLLLGMGLRVWLRGHGIDLSTRLRDDGAHERYRGYRQASGLLVPSRAAARRLAAIGLPDERIHVVPYAVSVSDTPPVRPARPGRPLRCLAVGRLVPKKGILFTLDAFAEAAKHGLMARLDVAGDGPLADQLQARVQAAGLGGHVVLHGRLTHDQVLALLAASDVLLHHAVVGPDGDAEGTPLVVSEAMAAGLAVVSTNHEGISELVTHDVSGLLVDERDVAGMAAHLEALAIDPALRRRLGLAAWASVRRRQHPSRCRALLLNLLGLEEAW